jgi:hypothetical protein
MKACGSLSAVQPGQEVYCTVRLSETFPHWGFYVGSLSSACIPPRRLTGDKPRETRGRDKPGIAYGRIIQ